MWIFSVYGFFSATKLPGKNNTLMIRARSKKHLNRLKEAFPVQLGKLDIKEWPGRDYPFRLLVDRDDWAVVVSAMVKETNWSNFKQECGNRFGHQSKYLDALHQIWSVMFQTYLKQRPKLQPLSDNERMEQHQRWLELEGADRFYESLPDDDIVAEFENSPEAAQLEDNPSEDERS